MPIGWRRISTRSTGPKSIKTLQRNWIGRSTGAEVDFFIGDEPRRRRASRRRGIQGMASRSRESGFPRKPGDDVLRIYTTRPDTLFGATYMVIAPEHPFVERLTTPEQAAAVQAYCEQAARKSDLDRTDLAKEKTGVFTGSYAINPVNGEPIPIWVADYVLVSYGTGAIMAVPAHDTRDFEFAKQFDLPIVPVVDPGECGTASTRDDVLAGKAAFVDDGDGDQLRHVQRPADAGVQAEDHRRSGRAQGSAARRSTTSSATGSSAGSISGASRSRSCTSSTPTASRPACCATVPIEQLAGRSAASWTISSRTAGPSRRWKRRRRSGSIRSIDGKRYKRETNTMPQWAGSCWYYLAVSRSEERPGARRSARSKRPGCRSICTSAAPSTPCCTCSTRASGTRCCSTAATSARRSRFRSWSTRA